MSLTSTSFGLNSWILQVWRSCSPHTQINVLSKLWCINSSYGSPHNVGLYRVPCVIGNEVIFFFLAFNLKFLKRLSNWITRGQPETTNPKLWFQVQTNALEFKTVLREVACRKYLWNYIFYLNWIDIDGKHIDSFPKTRHFDIFW